MAEDLGRLVMVEVLETLVMVEVSEMLELLVALVTEVLIRSDGIRKNLLSNHSSASSGIAAGLCRDEDERRECYVILIYDKIECVNF